MKKIFVWLLALAALAVICVFLGARWLENSWLPRRLADLSIQGQPVRFAASPKIDYFPPRLSLGAFEWKGAASGMDAAFSAQDAIITPDIFSFFGSQPELKELLLAKPMLTLAKKPGRPQETAGHAATKNWDIGIERFVAQDGAIFYSDGGTSMALENLRATGENLRPRQEMALQCDFGLSISENGIKTLDGNFALKTHARHYAPNLTFRNGSATFTATGPDSVKIFSPLHARFDGAVNLQTQEARLASFSLEFPAGRLELEGESGSGDFAGKCRLELDNTELKPQSGNLALEAPFRVNAEKLELRGADLIWGGVQASLDADFFFSNSGRLFAASGHWADGVFKASLHNDGGLGALKVSADKISLGEALAQLGIHGFAGGPTKADAVFELRPGSPPRGRGQLACGRLELEPFGELSMLLPLLGRSSAIMPKFVDQIKIGMTLENGRLLLAPVTGAGPEFSMAGSTAFDLSEGTVRGQLLLKALGLELPLAFDGPIRSPAIRIDPALLERKN